MDRCLGFVSPIMAQLETRGKLPYISAMREFLKALGPAVIVASVVLGPGSILSNSKVGAAYGFGMTWVVVLAATLMICMTALGARLGVVLERSLCEELAFRIGRPFALLVGLTIFCVCAAFQYANNLGVLAAVEPWLDENSANGEWWKSGNLILLGLNAAIFVFLFGLKRIYAALEKLMMLMVGLMITAFVGNFLYLIASGLPQAEPAVLETAPKSADPVMTVIALVGTTFSVAGAFYQAYLVREKGWTLKDLSKGTLDSVAAISVLGVISLVIMMTAALSFHGTNVELQSAADVARQLEPLFGPAAVWLFSLGILAAALSSFLVNAMIGGAMLSDGLGLGGRMDALPTKLFTALVLLMGMLVALILPSQDDRVGLVVFAQAMVVIGFPLLAVALLYLATRSDLPGKQSIPRWMVSASCVGLVVVLASAARVVWGLVVK